MRAVDADGNAGSLAIIVTVTDAVERISGQKIHIFGGLDVWENIGFWAFAYLAEKPIGEATWTLTGDDVAHFTWRERDRSGAKSYALEMPIQDFEDPADANADNNYEVTLEAVDADGNRVTRALTVKVVDRKDVPGVTVTPTRLSVTKGARAAYTVALDSRPAANVTITPTSGAPDKATVAPASHTFTPVNWSTRKTFTVTGVAAGPSTIGHAVTESTDGRYPTSLTIESVDVTVRVPPPPPPPPSPPPPPPPPPLPTVPSFGGADTARFSIAPDHADGAAVGAVSATDADGDALTYSLGGIDRAWFSIDDTGLIAVAPGTALAGLGKDRFSITAQVSDGEDERGLPEARPAIDDTLAVTITAFGVQGSVHRVPFLSPASHPYRQGFVRVINRSAQAGEVSIVAFDDAGVEHGPLTLRIEANAAVQFNSADLEAGNPGKGLASGTGAGEGAWRLELTSALDLEVLSYVRTPGGALASVHDVVPEDEAGHRVVFFNPASNRTHVSRLRIINPGEEAAAVRITGIDSAGEAGESVVALILAPRASRSSSARALESGEGEGLSGALGDGAGKWRLRVTADRPIRVMSLLASGPHLTNVSTAPGGGVPATP